MNDRRGGLPLWEAEHGRVKGHCRECGEKVPKGRTWWCGDDCVRAFQLRTDPNVQRLEVFNRDRGICNECGRDCVELRRELKPLLSWESNAVTLMALVKKLGGLPEWWRNQYPQYDADKIEAAVKLADELELLTQVMTRVSFWDMDHHKPLWEGGTNEIKNLRTLCIPCHREATRAGAARRASQRRQA